MHDPFQHRRKVKMLEFGWKITLAKGRGTLSQVSLNGEILK